MNKQIQYDNSIKADAESVYKMIQSDGWKIIQEWIEKRKKDIIEKLTNGETQTEIANVNTITQGKNIKMVVVNIDNNYDKYELKVWKLLQKKIDEYINIVKGG